MVKRSYLGQLAEVFDSYSHVISVLKTRRDELAQQYQTVRADISSVNSDRKTLEQAVEDALRKGNFRRAQEIVKTYETKYPPEVKTGVAEKVAKPKDFKDFIYTVGSIAGGLGYEIHKVKFERDKLVRKGLLAEGTHYIVQGADSGKWSRHIYSKEGYEILAKYLKQESVSIRKPTKVQLHRAKPTSKKVKRSKGSVADAVTLHLYENPEQNRFVVGELSKHFGVGSATIYRALEWRQDLIERKVDGRIVFERSSK